MATGATCHAMVLAATGQGKFVNALGPNALIHEGPLYVLDPKGEIAAVTARHRRRLGRVIVIDAFEVLGSGSDAFNPLDVATLPGTQVEDWAETLAWELSAGHESAKDPFWQNTATSLVSGLIASACNDPDPSKRHLGSVLDALSADDVVYGLAAALDKNLVHGAFARRRVAEFLQTPDGNSGSTRACVLTSALQYVHCFEAPRVQRCLRHSTLSLQDIVAGDAATTVYFVFPPTRTKSHRGLLRAWLSTILQAVLTRTAAPPLETLIMIDETANLGALDQLPLMLSYLRGVGASVIHTWQSLGQIMDLYPTQYRTIAENSSSIQVFGLHSTAIEPTAVFLGIPPHLLRDLGSDRQIVVGTGREPVIAGRVDYRTDPLLRNLAASNPRYTHRR